MSIDEFKKKDGLTFVQQVELAFAEMELKNTIRILAENIPEAERQHYEEYKKKLEYRIFESTVLNRDFNTEEEECPRED